MLAQTGIFAQIKQGTIGTILPVSTVLYIKGNALTDSSTFSPKTITGFTHSENAVTFDTNDGLYNSGASMIFPSVTTSRTKYSAKINNVSLGNAPWTIEMWIKRIGVDARMSVLTFLPPSPGTAAVTFQPILGAFGANFSFWEDTGDTRSITGLAQNTWAHLAICRQSNNTLKMFLNGTQFFSGNYSRNNTSFNELYLGAVGYRGNTETARSSFKLCHLHVATECYYTVNFTANKATGFT
jgi:hypothetical protein